MFYKRILALHFLVALWNLSKDFNVFSGPDGIYPVHETLAIITESFTLWNTLKFFPSLLWFFSPATLIKAGYTFGVLAIIKPSSAFFFILYMIYASFTICHGLVLWFPWDCMLCEALFVESFDNLFLRKWLLFRVVFGFGKHKFFGATFDDSLYLKSMACWQPLATCLGSFMSLYAPDWVFQLAIGFTFFTELIFPFLAFTNFSRAFYFSVCCLMVGIQLVGNFGWFNSLTFFMATSLFSSQRKRSEFSIFTKGYLIASIIFLIPSEWNSPSVFYENQFPMGDLFRVLSSYRVLHTYGVFPPKSLPMIKPIGSFEYKCTDSSLLHPLSYKYQNSGIQMNRDPRPFEISPIRFPRFDFIIGFYAASNVFSSVSGLGPLYVDSNLLLLGASKLIFTHRTHDIFQEIILCDVDVVQYSILGLRPTSTGWEEVSRHLAYTWGRAEMKLLKRENFVANLPPSMVSLRLTAKKVHSEDVCKQLWDTAHRDKQVDFSKRRSTRTEYLEIKSAFDILSRSNCKDFIETRKNRKWAGYLSCLTAYHLVPQLLHPAICVDLLKFQSVEFEYTRIPIPPWILDKLD